MSFLDICCLELLVLRVNMEDAYMHASCFCRFVVPRLACPSALSLWWCAASDWDEKNLQAEKVPEKYGVLKLVPFVIACHCYHPSRFAV